MIPLPVDNSNSFAKWLLTDFHDNNETVMIAPGSGFYATPGKGLQEARVLDQIRRANRARRPADGPAPPAVHRRSRGRGRARRSAVAGSGRVGAALWLRRDFEPARAELAQAIARQQDRWDLLFWYGLTCASLGRNEEAVAALEKSLTLGLPPILLAPLRWLEQDKADFYEQYAKPILARYG